MTNRIAGNKWLLPAAICCCMLTALASSPAQTGPLTINSGAQGNNAVYAGNPSPTTTIGPSTAYIDAYPIYLNNGGGSTVLCSIINGILTGAGYPNAGAVIDARGIPTQQTCALSPFGGVTKPSTILLPPGKIIIQTTWILPDKTRIIGAGRTQTTLLASTSPAFSGTTMLQMCGTGTCTGVSISDLQISNDCACTTDPGVFDGVVNMNSQEGSYINNVNFRYIEGTSLDVETSGANNSGPYTDLNITMGGQICANIPSPTCFPKTTSVCVELKNVSTRGIHSATCTSNGTPNVGFALDGNSNSIEDIHFEGLVDGIRVGQNGAAAANVIASISGASGATGGSSGPLINVVHVCGSNPKTSTVCSSSQSVSDLSLLDITSFTSLHDSIVDDVSGTELGSGTGDLGAALYVLGQPYPATSPVGFSRYSTTTQPVSTSPTPVPDWGIGALGSTSGPTGSCPSGSIFSNTNGNLGHALWLCVNSAWKFVK